MVHPARFELTTFGSGNQRSIQLSYGCLSVILAQKAPKSQSCAVWCQQGLHQTNGANAAAPTVTKSTLAFQFGLDHGAINLNATARLD